MAQLLSNLLDLIKVGIISGGTWSQFTDQVINHLPDSDNFPNLSLLPTCGTKFYRYLNKEWKLIYSEDFDPDERHRILSSFEKALALAGYHVEKTWGDVIEDRGSQITFSGLGQQAPLDEKIKWDPEFAKRKRIKIFLDTMLSRFSVRMGGSTSIDVTKPGIDKAYGINKLRDILEIPISDMQYIGDAIFPGGNDYPAEQAGVSCTPVRDPEHTKLVIKQLIANFPSQNGRNLSQK